MNIKTGCEQSITLQTPKKSRPTGVFKRFFLLYDINPVKKAVVN
jgi:hypothetical protein